MTRARSSAPTGGTGRPIELLHQTSPGRIRIRVFELYRSDQLRLEMERRISQIPHVVSARGNTLTGTLLILFDPRLIPLPELLEELQGLSSAGQVVVPAAAPSKTAGAGRRTLGQWWEKATASLDLAKTVTVATAKMEVQRAAAPREDGQGLAVPPRACWHAQTAEQTLALLDSSPSGLDQGAAGTRLALYGPNCLEENKRRSGWKIFAEQFLSIPVAMLGASAVISIATGGVADAVVIGGVVLINAIIGYVTESSAERTINALGSLTPTRARVIRGGQEQVILVSDVVVGDLILLAPGSYVAADARLIASDRLSVDESALTGESVPASKRSDVLVDSDTPLGERLNMVHMGTVVTGGSGIAVVTAGGLHSEIGTIQSLVGSVATPDTPMQRQLDDMGVQLALFSGGICALVFGVGILRGYSWLQMLNSSISLAVAAVPEGLPAVATTTLALGIREMQQRKVLVRQLPAVESLGSVQVICLDKTGTLTMNQMKVVAIQTPRFDLEVAEGAFRHAGERVEIAADSEVMRLLEMVTLCSEVKLGNGTAAELEGSPTESALVEAALLAGMDTHALRARLPLSRLDHRAENRPYMLSLHEAADGDFLVAVKGSPAEVLALCTQQQWNGECHALDREARQRIMDGNEEMAGRALRVLGVAYGRATKVDSAMPEGLIWLGLIAMEDILRPGMAELMGQFHDAGIETVMITGDQSATAYSVAKRLGLSGSRSLEIVDSVSLDRLEPEILANIVKDTAVFARVSPAHKLKIVQALQGAGKVVAMTGDGINDGPALKAADVGVAMGKQGTDVARSVADVVLQDDNLHTMITAVEQGRTIYSNIRKSLRFLLSTNLSEIEVMLLTTALGMGEALNPMQLLWINLMTDIFPALALALEPPERDVLSQKPRDPHEPIIRRDDIRKLLKESSLITAGCVGVYAFSLARYGAGPRASSNAFMTLTLAQLFHAIVCRSEESTLLDGSRAANPYLKTAIAASLGIQALTVLVPSLRGILRLAPMLPADLLAISAGAGLPFIVNEATKTLRFPSKKEIET